MKIKYVLITAMLTIAMALQMFAQSIQDDKTNTEMKKHDLSGMLKNATVDTTVDGLHMKIWLMTQKQHEKMMKDMKHERKEMKDTNMAMNMDLKEKKHHGLEMDKTIMKGTHIIVLYVTDAVTGKEIDSASAKVLIDSPSMKNSSQELKPMMHHFGHGLTLVEKGKYQFTVTANVGEISKTVQFQYAVK